MRCQPSYSHLVVITVMVTTPATVPIRQTLINSSPPSTPTPQLIIGSTIPLMAKTLTKYMQSDSVEEMSIQMTVVVALRTVPLFSHSSVPIKSRQYGGTANVCYVTQTAPFLASWILLFN